MASPALHKRKLHIFQEFYTAESQNWHSSNSYNLRNTTAIHKRTNQTPNSCSTDSGFRYFHEQYPHNFFLEYIFLYFFSPNAFFLLNPHSVALVNFLLIISLPNWNEFFSTVSHLLALGTFFVWFCYRFCSFGMTLCVSFLHSTMCTLFCFHVPSSVQHNPALNLLDSS